VAGLEDRSGGTPQLREYGTYKKVKSKFGPQLRPDSGLRSQVKAVNTFQVVPSSLGSGTWSSIGGGTTVERIWHISDSQGYMLALASGKRRQHYARCVLFARKQSLNEHGKYKTVKARFLPWLRPDSGLAFRQKIFETFYVVPSSLASRTWSSVGGGTTVEQIWHI